MSSELTNSARAAKKTARRGIHVLPALAGLLLVLLAVYAFACLWLQRDLPPKFTTAELAQFTPSWPQGFLWGTATAAHQVEGGQHNDWTRMEEQPGAIATGEKSGRADDMWSLFAQDVPRMKALHANAYRMSIEWSRLEPEEGKWDEAAWARYADWVRLLNQDGITPMVTLLHYSLPLWMADRGGIAAPDFPDKFGRFAKEAAARLGQEVHIWCILNEPNFHIQHSYLAGNYPPRKRSAPEAVRAFAGMLRAFALASRALHARDASARVGAAISFTYYEPRSHWSLADWMKTKQRAAFDDWAFYDALHTGRIRLKLPGATESITVASSSYLKAGHEPPDPAPASIDEMDPSIAGTADWYGVNYYDRNIVNYAPSAPGGMEVVEGPGPQADLGWEMYPEGLLWALRTAHRRYHMPVYVTENGVPDAAGKFRASFIRGHAYAVARAISEGVPVEGYFYWSLLDNFEWTDGFKPRFGLYRVDYSTLDRKLAVGAEEFIKLAPR